MADAQPVSASPAAGTPAGDDDPFLRLHKMSITAGLGSGDYVAISGLAIASVLLGVASALVLFHIPLLLIIPAVGAACGVLAFVQVARSNGTLTGWGLALLGLALSLGLGGYEGARVINTGLVQHREQTQVLELIRGMGDDLVAGRYQDAYNRCDPDFRSNVKLATFEGTWHTVQKSPYLGNMTGLDWNGLLNFDNDPLTGQRIAGGMVLIKFSNSTEPIRTDMFFRLGENGWAVNRIPQLFTPPGQQQGGGQSGQKGPAAPTGKPQMYGPPKPS